MPLLAKLFIGFFQVGLFSVGGGYAALPLIQSQIVDKYKLLTLAEFTDLITIAEMTPGPLSINSATFVGIRVQGILGAILCTLACILPSLCICLILAKVYYKYRSFAGVQEVLGALRPAVVALITSAAFSILLLALFNADRNALQLSDFRIVEFLLFIGCLLLLRIKKVNPILIIFGSGVVGMFAYGLIGLI